ncbi:MAG: DUF192 domain-containing protein [Halobacteriaceae archaeon]
MNVDARTAGLFAGVALLALAGAALAAVYYVPATAGLGDPPANRAQVVVTDGASGERLGVVTARVADTPTERYTGLSDTASLAKNEGMLFVYRSAGRHAYVMRDMAFPLDIVYVGADGTITAIHHAPVPPPGTDESDLTRYAGTGQYVLEVNRGWTTEHGVEVGDEVAIEYGPNATSTAD